jgi:hypothetical protein
MVNNSKECNISGLNGVTTWKVHTTQRSEGASMLCYAYILIRVVRWAYNPVQAETSVGRHTVLVQIICCVN